MESDAKYIVVGAVTLVVTAALVFSIFWLAGASPTEAKSNYTIRFQEQTLKGLQIGGPVTVRGVRVGSVSSIKIDPNDVQIVEVLLELPAEIPLTQGTTAVISRSLLTGIAAIDLVGLSQQGTRIKPGSAIPEGRTDLQELASSIPEFLDEVAVIVQGIEKFLSPKNAKNLEKTLENMQVLTSTLAGKEEELTSLIDNLNSASVSINKTTKNIEEVSSDATEAIGKVSKKFEDALSDVSEMLLEVQQEVRELSSKLSRGMELLTESAVSMGTGAKEVSTSLKSTLQNYEEPREIIFGVEDEQRGPGE